MADGYQLCMDVGGTEIKAAILVKDTGIREPRMFHGPIVFPSLSNRSRDEILDHLIRIIEQVTASLPEFAKLKGIGFAFPGPFDYENGISRMQNIGKYDSIFGVRLMEELRARMWDSVWLKGFADVPIRFVNDVAAFALGELHFGAAVHVKKAMFVCIGTGCGSAFSLSGKLVGEEAGGVPAQGYIYPAPFLDGCIDDYISKRGLEKLTKEKMGSPYDGLKLSQLVKERNEEAKECFMLFGYNVRKALAPYLDTFQPECLVMGGQIIKSASLFLTPLELCCSEKQVALHLTAETSIRSMQGVTTLFGLEN